MPDKTENKKERRRPFFFCFSIFQKFYMDGGIGIERSTEIW